MNRSSLPRRSLAAGFLLLLLASCASPAAELENLDAFPKAQLEIVSGKNKHVFDIWIADTQPRQMQGLMFVRDLPADRGMIFEYGEARILSMWMKNTYIPLDMLFIDAQGHIASIAENTTPHSLKNISSSQPVTAVLEVKAGEVKRRQIKRGDSVVIRQRTVVAPIPTSDTKTAP